MSLASWSECFSDVQFTLEGSSKAEAIKMQPLLKDDEASKGEEGVNISRIVLLSRSNTWQVSCAMEVQLLTWASWEQEGHMSSYGYCEMDEQLEPC